MEYQFTAELTHDLPTNKEFQRTYNQSSLFLSLALLLYSCALILNVTSLSVPYDAIQVLILTAVIGIIALIQNPPKGNVHYKRLLQSYNGQPPRLVYTFRDDGIHCTELQTGNQFLYPYTQFRRVVESPRMLLLVMHHQSCILLRKDQIQGGTADQLLAWFWEHCPHIRRKKSRKTGFGKWVHRIFRVVLIVCTLVTLLNFPGFSLINKLTGRLDNSNSYQEMADALAPLGISVSEQTISELEAYDADYLAETGRNYYAGSASSQKVLDLMYWEGAGIYDEDLLSWTPSDSGLYCQELEVINPDTIYRDFLTGLSAMDEDLNFTNVREDYRLQETESSSGRVDISFDWNGQHHRLEASYDGDWFDTDMIYALGGLIAADSDPRDLYFTQGNDLCVLFYYGDAQQVRQLEKLTGLDFYDTLEMAMGH